MPAKRKGISKKTRFDVFKRDAFTCQYCGATPPQVVLQVDHVVAFSAGGACHIDNYVTSCQPCNIGKGAGDLKVAPQSLSEKAKDVAEREEQLIGYQRVLEGRRERIEDEMWRVAEVLEHGSSEKGIRRDWLASIRKFNEMLGLHVVLECADIACSRFQYGSQRKVFLYFCGVCWRRVRAQEVVNSHA